jgi:hypothetical protein
MGAPSPNDEEDTGNKSPAVGRSTEAARSAKLTSRLEETLGPSFVALSLEASISDVIMRNAALSWKLLFR